MPALPLITQEAYGYPIFCYDKDGNHGLVGLRFDDIFESHVPEESNIRLFVNVLPQIWKFFPLRRKISIQRTAKGPFIYYVITCRGRGGSKNANI